MSSREIDDSRSTYNNNNNNTELVTRHMSIMHGVNYEKLNRRRGQEGCQCRYDLVCKHVLSCFLKDSSVSDRSVR